MPLDPDLPPAEQAARAFLISQVGAIMGLLPMSFARVRALFASIANDDPLWRALPHALQNLADALPGLYHQTAIDVHAVSLGAPGDVCREPIWPGPGPAPGDGSGSKGGLS